MMLSPMSIETWSDKVAGLTVEAFVDPSAEICEHRRCQRGIFEKLQRGVEDGVLARRIVRRVERVTMLERDEERPGRAHALGHFAKELDRHGRNPLTFQFGRDQTHGLVAHWSDRNQQRHVHGVFDQQPRRGRGALLNQPSGGGNGTHERQVTAIDRTDATPFGQFARAVDGQGEIRVLKDARMVE